MILWNRKGQINLEFLAGAFIYLIALGSLMTIGSDILPQFSNNMDKASLNLEAQEISTEVLTHPGHYDTGSNAGPNWHMDVNRMKNMDAFGLANSTSGFLRLDRDKINSLESFEYGEAKQNVNYSQFRTLTDTNSQFLFNFVWTPVIDTNPDFIKTEVQPLNESMLGYWPMDGTSGPVEDVSGNQNDGTTQGGVIRGFEGVFKTNTFTFAGPGNYVEIDDNENFKGGDDAVISVGGWFYSKNPIRDRSPLISKTWSSSGSDWELIVQNSTCSSATVCRGSKPYIGFYSSAISRGGNNAKILIGSNGISTGEWHHAMFTLDERNNELSLYLDGKEVYEDTSTGEISNSTASNIHLGARRYQNTDPIQAEFGGRIDEVRIYNGTLEGEEVRRLYREGPPNIKEPTTSSYDTAENVVHFGEDTLNGSNHKFLVTAHNGIYDTVYVSQNWDFQGADQIGTGDSFEVYSNENYTVTDIQNQEHTTGSTLILNQQLKSFGPSNIDSDSRVVRMDRYVIMDEEPMRVEVLAW